MIDQGRLAGRGLPRRFRVRRPRQRRLAARVLNPRVLIGLVVALALLGGGWLWFRDSSLVAVHRVSVTGVSGADAGKIRRALAAAARNMTTLDVSMSELRTAVAPYPAVKDVRVSTQFPHGMRIQVIEEIPVAAVVVAGRAIAVASDGTLLNDAVGTSALPRIPLAVPPGGTRLAGAARGAVSLLAAAPYQMLPRLVQVTTTARHGLTAEIRNGPSIYFGDSSRLAAKWTAAVAVLANSTSAGAVYIDVSDPERPAAGGGTPAGSSSPTSTTGSSSTSPATTQPGG